GCQSGRNRPLERTLSLPQRSLCRWHRPPTENRPCYLSIKHESTSKPERQIASEPTGSSQLWERYTNRVRLPEAVEETYLFQTTPRGVPPERYLIRNPERSEPRASVLIRGVERLQQALNHRILPLVHREFPVFD